MKKEDLYKLLAEKGYCEEKIEGIIEEKKRTIGPHITNEGLFALLAAEHGVREDVEEPSLTIESLQPGLSNLNILARVIRIYDEKEFKKGEKTGKRQTMLLGDQTGKIYLTLWDREVDQYYNRVHNGNVVRLLDIITTQGPSGTQLGLGFNGRIVVEDESNYKDLFVKSARKLVRKDLGDLAPGDRGVEVRATVSNIYRLNTYDACPECNRGLIRTTNNNFYCEHCKTRTSAKKSMVLELGMDDGSGHVRAVLFGDSAAEVLNEGAEAVDRTLQEYIDAGFNPKNVGLEYIMENRPGLLGSEILVAGSITESEFKGILMNVFDVKPIDYVHETNMVLDRLDGEFGD